MRYSVSQLRTYTECPRKWYMSYVLEVGSQGTASMKLGSLMHIMLADYHAGRDTNFDVLGREYSLDLLTEAIRLMPFYQEADKNHHIQIVQDGYTPEVWLEIPVGEDSIFGRCDFIAFDSEGKLIIGEHKTSSQAWNEWRFMLDFQTGVYAAMGGGIYPNDGVSVLFNVIKTTKKKEPVWEEVLQREVVKAPSDKRYDTLSEVREVVRRIKETKLMYEAYKTEGFSCGFCCYNFLCVLGNDPQVVKESLFFVPKVKREEVEINDRI